MVALQMKAPELALKNGPDDKDGQAEAERLADALSRVADHYGITGYLKLPTHPLVNLSFVAWAIYMPRLLALKMRYAAEAAKDVTPRQPSGLAPPAPRPAPPPEPVAPGPAPPAAPQGPMQTGDGSIVVRPAPIPGLPQPPLIKLN